MKHIVSFLVLLIVPVSFYAQNEQWSDPVPITDSITNNQNVTLSTYQEMYGMGDTLYACWENWTDASSTSLYWRSLIPLGPPHLLLSQPNVHFKNPRIYKYNTGDTAFGVYFQTDMNGNWDIYYVCYLRNGTVSQLIPVRTTSEDETNFHYDISDESLPEMVWEQNGRILYKRSNTDTVQFDRNDCHTPLINKDHLFWTKTESGNTNIYYSTRSYFTGLWSSPVLAYGTVSLQHLSIGNDTHGSISTSDLVFDRMSGSHWRLMDFDPTSTTQYPFPDFNTSDNIFPSYLGLFLITDHPDYLYNTIKTFASDSTGNLEIWVTPTLGYNDYINISNYGNSDTHPQLFNFFEGGDNHLFDIWESWRNGRWQLWMTTMDILTGINEKPGSGKGALVVHPNPFREEITIDFIKEEPGSVDLIIYNMVGKKVAMLRPADKQVGKISLRWNGRDENGSKLAPGVYFFTLKTKTRADQKKIVIY
jgi:hypothetical protein